MRRGLNLTEAQLAELQRKHGADKEAARRQPRPAASKPPKYKNKKTVFQGITFDSAHEARCWADLLLLEKAGKIRNLQRQVSFPLMVNGVVVGRYRADFFWWERHGGELSSIVVADAKSEFTVKMAAWTRTKALMRACYAIEVRELL